MNRPKIKICGLKDNAPAVIELQPDYVGFIFYKGSSRYYDGLPPDVPEQITQVGVFVNHTLQEVLSKVKQFGLGVVQLHGEETDRLCRDLKDQLDKDPARPLIWKAFGVGPQFDFDRIASFQPHIDAILLDTKGELRGGNGVPFNWELLEHYTLKTPIVLSGGIGPESAPDIKAILQTDLPIEIIDINSRFEIEPGFKNILHIKTFMHELSR